MSSRIPGFYRLPVAERRAHAATFADLPADDPSLDAVISGADPELLSRFVENVVGGFSLPLGVAVNFVVDGRDVLIPMAVEESSVVAAASNMARLVRPTGGFVTELLEERMIGQVQLRRVPDPEAARAAVEEQRDALVAAANELDPTLTSLGGGCTGLELRSFDKAETDGDGDVLVVHFLVDCKDAMGANTVNRICETLAPRLAELTGGVVGLRILSNLADRRLARARCRVRAADLAFDGRSGDEVVERIVAAARFATYDPYRAATHNKGIMNGVDPVVVATGNDWRAIEAGAHAYAARDGRYRSLSRWDRDDATGDLLGELTLPVQVGTVGGVTRLHPAARFSLRVLGVQGAGELGRILAAVGLAQNMGALRALGTEGINKGHMRLHQANLDLAQDT